MHIVFIPSHLELCQANVVALIEGSQANLPACAISTVAGVPLIRLHGNTRLNDQCENAVHMTVGYRNYAHATLDILAKFRWDNIALVFDGECS